MSLSLTATLSIAYKCTPLPTTLKKQKAQAPLEARLEPHPHHIDLKQNQLSAEILLMQRRIRESKRQDYNSSQITPKQKHTTLESAWMATKYDWEELSLEEVQPGDLQAMDLTGLSLSLLAHPKGARVDSTEQERKMLMALLEKKTLRGRETWPSRNAVK